MLKVGLARVISARLRGALLAVAAVLGLWSLPANAVIITVGGVDYDVVFFTNGFGIDQPSFTDNAAALQATPWFGNPGLAEDFAEAYDTQVTGGDRFNLSTGVTDLLAFAHTTDVDTFRVFEGGGVNSFTFGPASPFVSVAYAYTVPIAAVPEIDGNALAKALFLLFTLYVWILVRRNRRFA